MNYNVVYRLALQLYSAVRYKEYADALTLCDTLSKHLKQIIEENKNDSKIGA